MVERGEPLGVNEEAPIGEFLDHMREETESMGALFDLEDARLASIGATFVSAGGISATPSIDAVWFDEEDFNHAEGLYSRKTREFLDKHDLDESDIPAHWKVIEEEIDEFKEAFEEFEYLETTTAEGAAMQSVRSSLAEEMADVVFTIHLLAHLSGIDLRQQFREKADYNLQKSGQRNEEGKIIDDAEDTDE